MNNQEIARGLKLLADGFTVLSQAFSEKVVTGVDVANGTDKTVQTVVNTKTNEVVSQKEVKPETPKKEEVAPKEDTTSKAETGYTKESLNALSYNEIKAIAKENGVKAVGSKVAIIESILATVGEVQEEALDEAVKDTVVEDVADDIEDEIEEIEDEETENEDEEVEEENIDHKNLYESVVKDLEDYTDEELADILAEVGLSPKGKRQALLSKIVQAIEDGVLAWDEEESADEEYSGEEQERALLEKEDDTTEEEYDFVTEARKSACMDLEKSIRKDFKTKKLSHKDIIKFLKGIDEEFVSGGAESDLEDYIYVQFNLVDEDGELHEMSDPYYIGESVCCCGQELSELEADEFVCEICGESYTM